MKEQGNMKASLRLVDAVTSLVLVRVGAQQSRLFPDAEWEFYNETITRCPTHLHPPQKSEVLLWPAVFLSREAKDTLYTDDDTLCPIHRRDHRAPFKV